ncbi:hypothetical protein RHMOL_Rhmol08G0328200 [Rhododendron molle]|uniref:Uncharacterized protein n=1 Tax=Rhododendron molle TaxID=49168 RepID=A0ACC0MV06_RHOML|nr:hypothetical protein RHMOL_Rhmol08G0328200 [Rhododendron molle]
MTETEVAINIHDHGMTLDDRKRRVQCNYCAKVVSGFSRLKCHLGGVRGDVAPCEEVPTGVKDLMRTKLIKKKKGYLSKEVGELSHPDLPWKRNLLPHSNAVNDSKQDIVQTAGSGGKKSVKGNSNSVPEVVSCRKRRIPSPAAPSAVEELASHQAQICIARFFYENDIDFSAAKSPSFRRMINATLDNGQTGFRIPSYQEMKGQILRGEVKEMQQYVKETRNSWASTGCSILLDGWIDENGRNLLNILVHCPRGPIYLRSLDISAALGNVDALQMLFDEVIMEVGADNVIQIITYSTSLCMEAVGKLLMEKHRTLFWTVSASHCLELMLEKIGMMDLVKGILKKAKTITKFIYSRATVLKLMRWHTDGCDLIYPSRIKSAMPFLTLENIMAEMENLQKMFVSSEWSTSVWASSQEGRQVADLMADRSFWTGASVVLKATIPLVRVLHLINEGDKPELGFIYETIDQAKETIKEEFKNKKAQYIPFWATIDEIWNNHLHSPLHSAGYFLNPGLFYSSDFFTDAEVATGLLCCIVRMVEGKHVQDLVTLQVEQYRAAKGPFGQGSTLDRRSSLSPALWWSYYGGECPELQRLAIRILSQTCDGASKYQLKRSLAEKLLTKGRNYIEQQRLNDQAFMHYNLCLQNFKSGIGSSSGHILGEEIDSMDDWIVDEAAQAALLQNCEPSWMELADADKTSAGGRGVNIREDGGDSSTECAASSIAGSCNSETKSNNPDESRNDHSFCAKDFRGDAITLKLSSKTSGGYIYRLQLEKDVQRLQQQLQEEMELHAILKNAIENNAVIPPGVSHLPAYALELLSSIAILESAILKLEEEFISLHFQTVVEMDTKFCQPLDVDELSTDVRPKDLWDNPNRLSEEMVRCMKNIFISLADSTARLKSSASETQYSSLSPCGHLSNSSMLLSERSRMSSGVQSPQLNKQYNPEVLATENTFDPYRVGCKLSWGDIGSYRLATEVSWMSVGRKQLEYAAGALRRFRLSFDQILFSCYCLENRTLVEQLARVNPIYLSGNEKLAFWINLYNALIMHAYLAYGVPRSELKLFSLMQKAAYTIGGHSLSAAAIEYVILKMKPPAHRPQIALLLALHKLKVLEEQRKYAIDSSEPLVAFALSCGLYSSPAVRIYTASNVREELHEAQRDFIRASVGVSSKGRLLVPKMLHCFSKSFVDDANLAVWISHYLPPHQAAFVEQCISKRRQSLLSSRNCGILPFDSRFRYLFLPEQM